MQFEELETSRLYLVNIANSDCDFIYNQFSNNFINKYLFDAEPVNNMEEAQQIIDFYTVPEPRNQHRWILVLKNSNIKIGTCGFHCLNAKDKSLEVGYDLLEEYNGKGFMYEALMAITNFAISKLNIKMMEAHVYEENKSSIKLLEKIGFQNAGELNLEYRDKMYKHYVYKKLID